MRLLPVKNEQVAFDVSDYAIVKPNLFITVCPICYESNRLDFAITNGLGKVIYFPEMSQADINMIVHTHLNIVHENSEQHEGQVRKNISYLKNNIKIEFSILESREKALHELFDANTSKEFVGFIARLTDADYIKHRHKLFKSLRYLPDLDAYKSRAQGWKNEAYSQISLSRWESILQAQNPELYESWKAAFEKDSSEIMFPRVSVK